MSDKLDVKKIDQMVDAAIDAIDADPENESISSQSKKEMKIASVIQMHKLAGTMRTGPGRPKKPNQETMDALAAYHTQMARQQVDFVDNDPIVLAAMSRKESPEILQAVRQKLARIQASLEFRRIEDEKLGGKESAQILSRQTAVLRALSEIELKIKEMGIQTLDLHGEAMQKVFLLFVERVKEVATEVLPKAEFDLFFNRLETALEGWEEEADSVIR